MSKKFDLVSNYKPAGDQPKAIKEIVKGTSRRTVMWPYNDHEADWLKPPPKKEGSA